MYTKALRNDLLTVYAEGKGLLSRKFNLAHCSKNTVLTDSIIVNRFPSFPVPTRLQEACAEDELPRPTAHGRTRPGRLSPVSRCHAARPGKKNKADGRLKDCNLHLFTLV